MSEPVLLNNRYRLEESLGSGGMAEVYRAHDLTLERIVAIKILRPDYSQSAEFRTRFHHEAKAAANLSHPNIVTVHDFGFSANQLFIVMEYVPGQDLKTMMKEKRRFSIQESIELITQACAALGYAHRAGLVHCDVKPQNLLVTPDKRLKVADFGIARALATISPDERSEVVWGSPQYFSPEQAAGNAPSPASDVYSLGVILYEMLTGRLPFTASTPQELARMHREALPPSPRRFNPSIPVALEQIIIKVLSKETAARYRTADQFGQVLRNLEKQLANEQSVYHIPSLVTTLPPAISSNPASHPIPSQPIPIKPKPRGYETIQITNSDSDLVFVTSAKKKKGFDTFTWMLALLAFLLVGGLIPFWLWVYYVLNPPI